MTASLVFDGADKLASIVKDLSGGFALPATRPVVKGGKPVDGLSDLAGSKPPGLPFGLHLMYAPSGGGKTVTSLALSLWYKALSVPSYYEYVGEPRAADVADTLVNSQTWENRLTTAMAKAKGGVCFIDSITYLVTALPKVRELEAKIATVTYRGGLRPIDVVGILMYDALAAEKEVALVATLNSDLFPSVSQLEGACEGAISVSSAGSFTSRNREGRVWTNFEVPSPIFKAAASLLNLSKQEIDNPDRI